MAIAVSNPTAATGRTTAGEVLKGRYHYLRQDLTFLKELASVPENRVALSALPAPDSRVKRALLEERSSLIRDRLPHMAVTDETYPLPKHPDGSVPITTLRVDGVPIRPEGAKRKGNAVFLQRTFGSRKPQDLGDELDALLATMDPATVREALMSRVFTSGTLEGFKARLALISSDKCQSIKKVLGTTHRQQMRHLDRLLPVDVNKLPNWNGGDGDLMELLKTVTITKHASAGAPYWKKKGDCMEAIFHTVEYICMAMKEGNVTKVLQENPELFVIECKNKPDRYEVDKLDSKTRPIFNPPAHFGMLASFLMQGMSDAMHKVGGDVPTCNAYGWSAAKGGITRLVEDVKRRKKAGERGWCYVYSDDGDLYINTGGKLWRVSPDIKQMDSCVDYDTVEITWDYVRHCYQTKHGESPFWNMVIEMLKSYFKHPRIMISGTQLYTKNPDGLLSGSVGTTLYGTVKSAACYTDMLEAHVQNPAQLLNATYVSRYMKEHYGLTLKEGTWAPELVNLDPVPAYLDPQGVLHNAEDALYGDGKFLGTQYVYVATEKGKDWMPWTSDKDWASCILTPRAELDQASTTARQRLQFDRLRGYLTTGAVFSPAIYEACKYWVDRIPGEVILMQPQGTMPPEGILLGDEGQDFEYPTPEFMPDPFWVYDIYATPGHTFDRPHTQIFRPNVLSQLSEMRQEKRKVRLLFNKAEQKVEAVPFAPNAPLTIGVEMDVVKEEPQKIAESHWKGPPPVRAEERPSAIPIPGYPLDLAMEQTERQAALAALHIPPPPDFAPMKEHEVITLYEARHMVDGPPAPVPVTWRTGERSSDLVHYPTPGGMVQMKPMHADLLADYMDPYIAKFVAIPPDMSPNSAFNKIMAGNKITGKFKFSQRPIKGRSTQRIRGEYMVCRFVHVVEEGVSKTVTSDPQLVQVWEGDSRRDVKDSLQAYVLNKNKVLGSRALEKEQSKDWALGATASKVPFSAVAGDKRPAPPPVLAKPHCPTTIPVEDMAGNVTMSGVLPAGPDDVDLSVVLPPPPEFAILDEDVKRLTAPPPPPELTYRPDPAMDQLIRKLDVVEEAKALPSLPITYQPYEPVIRVEPDTPQADEAAAAHPPRVNDLETYLSRLYRSPNRTYTVSSEEDTQFENVITVVDEDSKKNTYLGLTQVEEVFRRVGEWTTGNSPLQPHNTPDYQAVDFLRKLLTKTATKLRKNGGKENKPANEAEEKAPRLPPRQTGPPPKRPPKAGRLRDGEPPRRPHGNRNRRDWTPEPRDPRTRNRFDMDKGRRQRY